MAKKSPTPAEVLAADLAETRARLVNTIEELEDYVRPANIVARAFDKVSGAFVDEAGKPRLDLLAAAASNFSDIMSLMKGKKKD